MCGGIGVYYIEFFIVVVILNEFIEVIKVCRIWLVFLMYILFVVDDGKCIWIVFNRFGLFVYLLLVFDVGRF